MASGLFSGDSRYRLNLGTWSGGAGGTWVYGEISVTKTAGGGYFTGDPQWWRIRISGGDQDGYWTYDFSGGTPKTIGIANRSRNMGYGTFLVEAWVNMDSGLGQAYAAEWVTITNPATVPSAPATPTVSGIGTTSMTLSWSIPANNGAAIDQMLLRRYSTADGTGPYVDYPNAGNVTSRTVTDLTPGSQYSWAVYAHNSVGYSTPSGVRAAQTLAAARVPKGGVYVPAAQVQAPKGGALVPAQVKAPKNGSYVSTI